MKIKVFAIGMAALSLVFAACDETTDTIGTSLTSDSDNLNISVDTFTVASKTILADSVYSRNATGYLGIVKDPETNSLITGDIMVQFHTIEGYAMPDSNNIVSKKDNRIIADSCEISLYYSKYYGDSLSQMKLTAYEMSKPMEEGIAYYSNFDPLKEGYVRTDGIRQNHSYTLVDQSASEAERNSSNYVPYIRIKLNSPYTDTAGNTYNNYGTYLMRQYYDNPSNYQDSYKFLHNITPGFFVKMTSGVGSMAYVSAAQLTIYFRYQNEGADTVTIANTSFANTEEVLQTTTITNDKSRLQELASDNTCTYLKSPAGLFTELTLPVDEIISGHENDTINTAKLVIPRINNTTNSDYSLSAPERILMLPADSVYTFFDENRLPDNKSSFIATFSSTNNNYTFSNISGLVSYMQTLKKSGKGGTNWNKVVLVPVETVYSTRQTSSGTISTLSKVSNAMSLTSTRLVGGSQNPYPPIRLSVIYSKFNGR